MSVSDFLEKKADMFLRKIPEGTKGTVHWRTLDDFHGQFVINPESLDGVRVIEGSVFDKINKAIQ